MSTAVIPFHASLPAFMKDPALFNIADDVAGGISGAQPPYISIRSSKFRLVDIGGEEELVHQLHLDVVVLGANQHLSKIFYQPERGYDPADTSPPDCYSDNGVGPSDRAASPQHATCVACPNNAWGSKISEASGKKVKACSDSKKLAVILAKQTTTLKGGIAGAAEAGKQVYMLRVPATSMAKLRELAVKAKGAGIPLIGCVIRLTFNAEASYPQVEFQAAGYVDEKLFHHARGLVDSVEVKTAIGADDKPFAGAVALTVTNGSGGVEFEPPPAYLSAPVEPTPPPKTLNGGAAEAVPAETARKRGRPVKTATEVIEAVVEASKRGEPMPTFDNKANGPAVVMDAPPTDAALDTMMAKIFS